MTLAVMQPYFFPYIGYFQLISAADRFVIYDNVKYTKKGWINRNRMLVNGQDKIFSIPLKRDSDHLDIVERELAENFNRRKLLNQFEGAYRRAPYFEQTWQLLETVILCREHNLFRYLYHSIERVCAHLGISTMIQSSSGIPIDHSLKGQDKVLAILQALGEKTYINAVGGMKLYDRSDFASRGVELCFIKSRPFEYPQFGTPFVPWLSIIDVLMFNSIDSVRLAIRCHFDLVNSSEEILRDDYFEYSLRCW